jgi:parallel beta-helix repeat protein
MLYGTDYIISKNTIQRSLNWGVYIETGAPTSSGDNNLIINNQIVNNAWAFNIVNSNGTIITQNNVTNNTDGILALGRLMSARSPSAGYHLIYLNNFVDNAKVLFFTLINLWCQ